MNFDKIVTPSSQVDTTLPLWIVENYERFIEFMEYALQSEERIGFSQNLLQNLQKYRDFDTFAKPIVEFSYLSQRFNDSTESTEETYFPRLNTNSGDKIDTNRTRIQRDKPRYLITAYEDEKLMLFSGEGFPEENGVLMIDDEIILYRYRKGNIFYELQRGASGTTLLGDLLHESVYKRTEAADHYPGSEVYNLSGQFLSAILDSIHKTFATGFDAKKVSKLIDRSTVLENIRDFFQSKGTKLGIKALFKIIYAENDVDVSYPGDRMIIPSRSTWYEGVIIRMVPVPFALTNQEWRYTTPDKLIGSEMVLKSYNDNEIYGSVIIDYASHYSFEDEVQYEMYVEKDNIIGSTIANPKSKLTRALFMYGTSDDGRDVTTATVETTLGFPDSGIFIVGSEAVQYESKSFNQFFNCKRGFIGSDAPYDIGTMVMGPYYYEGKITDSEGVEFHSRAFPLGLAESVDVKDPGLLHTTNDEVYPNGPGRIDNREPIMGSLIENYDDFVASQSVTVNFVNYVGNYTYGISGIYFDDKFVFASSSNLPMDTIGPFSTEDIELLGTERFEEIFSDSDVLNLVVDGKRSDLTVGPELQGKNQLHVIPRRESILPNDQILTKGTDAIGLFVDGVPAYSCNDPHKVYQGKVTTFTIHNGGVEYVNPTLVINDEKVDEVITLDEGTVVGITNDTDTSFTEKPEVRISSGEYADVLFGYDRYGRITHADLLGGGRFYNDLPIITAIDASGRGKGAVFACEVADGQITSVTIVHPGIDYDPLTTSCVIQPKGYGADVEADIQFYHYDRNFEIKNTQNWFYDKNMGFVFEDKDDVRTNYGYVVKPQLLADYLEETPESHSPILGWAYDGNPIYGSYGYANKRDDSDGIQQYFSSYILAKDRSSLIASGGDYDTIGTLPPDVQAHPMGTFVEDYTYDPDGAIWKLLQRKYIDTEIPERIKTGPKGKEYLAYGRLPDKIDGQYPGLLDECNSVVCNTPEFPKELYPDGVRCYFVTTLKGEPDYPYIVGPKFCNRPISQNLNVRINDILTPVNSVVYDYASSFDETRLTFDYDVVERFRNRYLSPTKNELELDVVDTLDGGVSEVLVESGLPATTKVGDITLYDNFDTGGAGAEARVSFVKGEPVTDAIGSDIKTILISHIQIINLNACQFLNPDGTNFVGDRSHVFVRGTQIISSSYAKGVVWSYDLETTDLTVIITSKNLIQYGDTFRDERTQLVMIPYLIDTEGNNILRHYDLKGEEALEIVTENDINVIRVMAEESLDKSEYGDISHLGTTTYFGVIEPDIELDDLVAGDLWYSDRTGRLYVWYVDQDDTAQWVVTQPTGTIPTEGALDKGHGLNDPNSSPGTQKEQEENKVTISNWAPSERKDGSPLLYGDFWWSPQTGIMYMWFGEQWVCTDPNGTVPIEPEAGPSDAPNWYTPERKHPWKHDYETQLNVIVKLSEPRVKPNGDPLETGCLWFSPVTGKMYIRYRSRSQAQWIITNPIGMMPNKYALDISDPNADIGGPVPPLRPGPIIPPGDLDDDLLLKYLGLNYLWFEHLKHFYPEDTIRFFNGAPGSSAREDAKIVSIAEGGTPAAAVIRRGDPYIAELLDGTPTYNKTRSYFTITTSEPHLQRVGDEIVIEGATQEYLNNNHKVIEAGFVTPAEGYGVIEDGQVVDVVITNPGGGYTDNFYIWFYGNGGVGGYAYCIVNPLGGPNSGEVRQVNVEYGGIHYRKDTAKIIWPNYLNKNQFAIFTPETLGEEANITYSTNSQYPQNEARFMEVTSTGYQYEVMPPIVGLYKKFIDRAETKIEMDGTQIKDVEVVFGGVRYDKPKAVFVDRTGSGYGAEASVKVEDGMVTDIEVTKPGTMYVEPELILVETKGKYISLTDDIGRLKSVDVVKPGRAISPDRSLKPELMIHTRVVLRSPSGDWKTDDIVYQGIDEYRLVTGKVWGYDDSTQILTLYQVEGHLKDGEMLYAESGATGLVALEGQADARVVVGGASSPRGDFLDDKSKISERYSVIQDSYYYQWFSYVIGSPIEKTIYDSTVKRVVHPSGFIMFSDLRVNDMRTETLRAGDVQFLGPQ